MQVRGKRLRHPVKAIREPFGKAGLVVAVCALVLALTGAAIAAGALSGKQKKEVEKIAKKFAGKPGPAGANGAAGPQGPAGSAGAAGATGPQGATGPTGKEGSQGKQGPTGPTGSAGATGPEGPEGPEGSPWTAGGTLPSGETETGTWLTELAEEENEVQQFEISFPIPVAGSVQPIMVPKEAVLNEEVPEGCTVAGVEGSAENPIAAPGNLCMYEGKATTLSFEEATPIGAGFFPFKPDGSGLGVGPTGVVIRLLVPEVGEFAFGPWAVTAP
jgi:hypothetical protein